MTDEKPVQENRNVDWFGDLPLWLRYLVVATLAGLCGALYGLLGLVLFLLILGIYLLCRRGLY